MQRLLGSATTYVGLVAHLTSASKQCIGDGEVKTLWIEAGKLRLSSDLLALANCACMQPPHVWDFAGHCARAGLLAAMEHTGQMANGAYIRDAIRGASPLGDMCIYNFLFAGRLPPCALEHLFYRCLSFE